MEYAKTLVASIVQPGPLSLEGGILLLSVVIGGGCHHPQSLIRVLSGVVVKGQPGLLDLYYLIEDILLYVCKQLHLVKAWLV